MMASNESTIPKTTVLGIGGAGLKVLKVIASLPGNEWLNLAVADTDEQALNSVGIENSFAIGTEWTNGAGCGGNPTRGHNAFAHESNKQLEKFISGSSMLIAIAGLGMGTGTGGASIIGRMARRLKIPCIFILTMPFSFEGQGKYEVAKDGLNLLISDIDIVLPISNDILFTSLNADIPVKQAFIKADEALAHAAIGLAEVFRCTDLLTIGFAELKEIFGNKKTSCCIGMGRVHSEISGNRINSVMDAFIDSPLMSGEKSLKNADVVITTIVGGNDFQIGELKDALDIIKNMVGKDTKIISGVNTDKAYNDLLFITSLIINYENKEKKTKKATKPTLPNPWRKDEHSTVDDHLVQPELLLQSFNRGYFGNTEQNLIDGEDVDIPTHQRRSITLNTGL